MPEDIIEKEIREDLLGNNNNGYKSNINKQHNTLHPSRIAVLILFAALVGTTGVIIALAINNAAPTSGHNTHTGCMPSAFNQDERAIMWQCPAALNPDDPANWNN